jgi:hypothetical protein
MDWPWREHAAGGPGGLRGAAPALPAIEPPQPFRGLDFPDDFDQAQRAAHEMRQALLPPLVQRSLHAGPYTSGLAFTLMRWRAWRKLMAWAARWYRAHVFVRWLAVLLAAAPVPAAPLGQSPAPDRPDTGPPCCVLNLRAHRPIGPPARRAARWSVVAGT